MATQRERRTRKEGKRRKTGCINCRSGHVKCDEKQPGCGRCKRLGLDCKVSDFIVPSNWCSFPPDTLTPKDDLPHPSSTWDVFNRSISKFPSLPPPENAPASHERALVIDSEMAELLREYQQGIGAWMDLFDHGMSYQRDVTRRSQSSPLVMQAICALTAKQLNMARRGETREPIAVRYYGESLRLLINMLTDTVSCQEDALVATILLSSYELLASPGLDHRRHVSGALTLIKTHGFTARSKGLEGASFWVYVRLDIAMALTHECSTMLPPEDWNVRWAENETEEDILGNHILWILSKVIAFTFQKGEPPSAEILSVARSNLSLEVDSWFDGLPASFRGVPYGSPSREGFINHWFSVPASAAAMFIYHLAKLLLITEGINSSISKDEQLQVEIQHHTHAIGNICLSPISDGGLVQGVQPLYYAAKYIDDLSRKAKLWALLEDIETRLGFHTNSRIAKLQKLVEMR